MKANVPSSKRSTAEPVSKTGVWTQLFGIDVRALAVFRMAMGLLLLVDLGIRSTDLGVMYTDGGMFSRAEICYRVMTPWNWSFHFGGGSLGYQAILFGIAAVLAVALLVGFETRLATIGSWLMLLSLHHRVPPILSGADVLLRMLLFWGMFLPLGQVASLDRWRALKRGQAGEVTDRPVVSIATVAMLLQMPLMYFLSAIFKTNPVWMSGEVLAGALSHDFYVSRLGTYLLQFPGPLRLLTWATLVLEWVGPVLLFSPWRTGRLRTFFVGCFAALHVGIIVCLEVDLFSFVALTGLTLFLPSEIWRAKRFAGLWRVLGEGPVASPSPTSVSGALPVWSQWGVGMALVYVLLTNVAGLPSRPLGRLAPDQWRFFATALGLGQKWNMFEVVPSKPGWYVARARLTDGSEVDLLRGGVPVDWARPAFPAGIYPNYRWRKVFREMAYEDELGYHAFREPIARYLCRDWNRRHGSDRQVVEFDLVYNMSRVARHDVQQGAQITIRDRLIRWEISRLEEDRTTRTRL
ncbi:MAG: HTTM domain-containing protein [Verrucomicrobiales bacterium]|nr:HTTM domain-containing protein [Verrucomicrobiales bacterium]